MLNIRGSFFLFVNALAKQRKKLLNQFGTLLN